MDAVAVIEAALIFLGGVSYALAGYLKSAAGGEGFNPRKMAATVILSGIVSALNYLTGAAEGMGPAEAYASGTAETVLLEYLSKALRRLYSS